MPDLDMMKTAALKKEYAKVWKHKPLGQKANNDEWLIKKILEKGHSVVLDQWARRV